MANIEDAARTANDFLKRTLNPLDIKAVKVSKIPEGWEIESEVYEESSFIKALGLPTRVQDKHIYKVNLNGDMEVEAYERTKREERA